MGRDEIVHLAGFQQWIQFITHDLLRQGFEIRSEHDMGSLLLQEETGLALCYLRGIRGHVIDMVHIPVLHPELLIRFQVTGEADRPLRRVGVRDRQDSSSVTKDFKIRDLAAFPWQRQVNENRNSGPFELLLDFDPQVDGDPGRPAALLRHDTDLFVPQGLVPVRLFDIILHKESVADLRTGRREIAEEPFVEPDLAIHEQPVGGADVTVMGKFPVLIVGQGTPHDVFRLSERIRILVILQGLKHMPFQLKSLTQHRGSPFKADQIVDLLQRLGIGTDAFQFEDILRKGKLLAGNIVDHIGAPFIFAVCFDRHNIRRPSSHLAPWMFRYKREIQERYSSLQLRFHSMRLLPGIRLSPSQTCYHTVIVSS